MVPTNGDMFTHATVVAVGPGNVGAEGGRSETFDLKPGQTVLVLYREKSQERGGFKNVGIPVQQGDTTLHMYEQGRILGVLGQPGESVDVPASKLVMHA